MEKEIILSSIQWDKIQEATLSSYPNEMCGILTENDFIHLSNIHDIPEKNFRFDPKDIAIYWEQIKAIVHSHTRDKRKTTLFDLRTPSVADRTNQKKTNFPWLIVGTEGISVTSPIQFPRILNNNYLNRNFIWGINDCYTILQDIYYFELGILLPTHTDAITEDFVNVGNVNDIYKDYPENNGFRQIKVEDIKNYDVILVDNGGFQRNHLGIFINNEIIHQDMVSVKVPFENFLGRINKVYTYDR